MRISDWSSDVCSSDLGIDTILARAPRRSPTDHNGCIDAWWHHQRMGKHEKLSISGTATLPLRDWLAMHRHTDAGARRLRIGACGHLRSEARRVGKECVSTCKSWWSPDH